MGDGVRWGLGGVGWGLVVGGGGGGEGWGGWKGKVEGASLKKKREKKKKKKELLAFGSLSKGYAKKKHQRKSRTYFSLT